MVDYYDFRKGKYKKYARTAFYFTREEGIDLLISWVVLTGAYTLSQTSSYIRFMFNYGTYSWFILSIILNVLWMSAIVAAITFVSHELAHKFTAQKYGLEAHYKANKQGLLLGLLISLGGFLFLSPGAVLISGSYMGEERNGKISMAGPLTNIAIAIVFFPFTRIFFLYLQPYNPILLVLKGI
ncbi:MAG: hypothetical protein ACFFCS_13090, partial [Candidatus Hodarchaeota archaeon]